MTHTRFSPCWLAVIPALVLAAAGCDDGSTGAVVSAGGAGSVTNEGGSDAQAPQTFECQIEGETPDFVQVLGCQDDFEALASAPLDASIPGARAVKTVFDRDFGEEIYFQNSVKYTIHHEFAVEHLSAGQGFTVVPSLDQFNTSEYSSSFRRFVLGSLTHYEGPDVWAWELSPYDTATAEMIHQSFAAIRDNSFLGDRLVFHPTSLAVEAVAETLPDSVPLVTTDQLFEGIDYQPLNFAESYGRLTFITADELETEYVTFRDITVLDRVPNDISVTSGIITAEFQTPLAHINVLSQNRGTPNMALRGAYDDADLRALEGKWVRLNVTAFDYELEEVTKEVADAWWEANKPAEVGVPGADLAVTDLRDIRETVELEGLTDGDEMLAAIKAGTRAFGGKAANFGALAYIDDLPLPKAFSVPIYYYFQHMEENGFDQRVLDLLDDPQFQDDPAVRDMELLALREDIRAAPLNQDFLDMLMEKLEAEYTDVRMRFRSSTNAEDLDGFTGAGLYTSKSGDPNDPEHPIVDAIREVWASVWFFRAFEERSYRSIDHTQVGMALLVHRSFPAEEANGVALTNNPFDKSGLEPAFYVNVQFGDESVVLPPPGVSTDSYLHYWDQQGQPVTYLSDSNLVPVGEHVLTLDQIRELGAALEKIRAFFTPIYGPRQLGSSAWWAMDVEFKFDGEPGEVPPLFVKQARPFGNRVDRDDEEVDE